MGDVKNRRYVSRSFFSFFRKSHAHCTANSGVSGLILHSDFRSLIIHKLKFYTAWWSGLDHRTKALMFLISRVWVLSSGRDTCRWTEHTVQNKSFWMFFFVLKLHRLSKCIHLRILTNRLFLSEKNWSMVLSTVTFQQTQRQWLGAWRQLPLLNQ